MTPPSWASGLSAVVRDLDGFDTNDYGLDLLDADARWWSRFGDWVPRRP